MSERVKTRVCYTFSYASFSYFSDTPKGPAWWGRASCPWEVLGPRTGSTALVGSDFSVGSSHDMKILCAWRNYLLLTSFIGSWMWWDFCYEIFWEREIVLIWSKRIQTWEKLSLGFSSHPLQYWSNLLIPFPNNVSSLYHKRWKRPKGEKQRHTHLVWSLAVRRYLQLTMTAFILIPP